MCIAVKKSRISQSNIKTLDDMLIELIIKPLINDNFFSVLGSLGLELRAFFSVEGML